MASPTIGTDETFNYNFGTSFTATKPASLAEGDSIFVVVSVFSSFPFDRTITPPAGWSQEHSSEPGILPTYVFWKESASAADVAASNFSFSSSGGNAGYYAVTFRVENGGTPEFQDGTADTYVSLTKSGLTSGDYLAVWYISGLCNKPEDRFSKGAGGTLLYQGIAEDSYNQTVVYEELTGVTETSAHTFSAGYTQNERPLTIAIPEASSGPVSNGRLLQNNNLFYGDQDV